MPRVRKGQGVDNGAARLTQARKRLFESARMAAMHFGWPESTYRAHEAGTRRFGLEDAHKYAHAFGCNAQWLYKGAGTPSYDAVQPQLPNASPRVTMPSITRRRLPIFGQAVAGTDGRLIMNGTVIDDVFCPPGLEAVPDAYALFVSGESMEPRYYSGETVYVHPHLPYRRGQFVVVQIHDAADPEGTPLGYVKQYIGETAAKLILHQFKPEKDLEFDRKLVVSIHRIVLGGEG